MKRRAKRRPSLTAARVRQLLLESARGANELLRDLNREHHEGLSRGLALRLD